MYFDNRPCQVCGSKVDLGEHRAPDHEVDPDGTIDERTCTNPDCPTNERPRTDATPTP